MAAAMHLCGAKTTNLSLSQNLNCQSLWLCQRLDFVSSVDSVSGFCWPLVGSVTGFCRPLGGSCKGRVLKVSCKRGNTEVIKCSSTKNQCYEGVANEFTCVMKFGASSVASAAMMRELAELICSFEEERPVIVLSAMGRTTDNLLLAGERAFSYGVSNIRDFDELTFVKELHVRTVDELGVERSIISKHLEELEKLLYEIAMMVKFTLRTKDYLASFGECLSTRIFAAYLNKIGVKARQYDAFDIGFITTDDFTSADILEETYPAVANKLCSDYASNPAIPVVTGFLGKGCKSHAVTTLGVYGSDLTARTICKALGLPENQVWTDRSGSSMKGISDSERRILDMIKTAEDFCRTNPLMKNICIDIYERLKNVLGDREALH